MSEAPKKGELYSRQYIERGKPLADNVRFRTRIGRYAQTKFGDDAYSLRGQIIEETGASFPGGSNWRAIFAGFFIEGELQDVLSAITIIWRWYADETYTRPKAEEWCLFVQRALKEENVAYTIDERGGVHPLIDKEFTRNIATSLAGLAAPRYAAARSAFASAEEKLRQAAPDMKGAIRDVFEAAETLTKLITSSGKSLDAGFVRAEIEPRIQKHYRSDAVGGRSSLKAA